MADFTQGDTGTLSLTIKDGDKVLDLTNATVTVTLTYYETHTGNTKQATITDAVNGKCQITLTSNDLLFEGVYVFQAQVQYPDGTSVSSNMQKFTVGKKIGYIPTFNGGGSTSIASGANGHILVNGQDIKVYDETEVNNKFFILTSDMNNLITKSSTNGDIVFNGVDLKVYDDTSIQNFIQTYLPLLQRLGIDSNGNLTVDGKIIGSSSSGTLTNTAPSITSSYNTNAVYTTDNISIPFTVTDAEGGTMTATYTIDGVPITGSISTGANTWSVGTLSAGSHTLTIKVSDNGGLTSNVLVFNITSNIYAPNPVTNLLVPNSSSITPDSITVTWTAPNGGNSVTNYEVAFIPSGGSWTVVSSTVDPNTTSYTFTGLQQNTGYTFRVVALDVSGDRSTDATVNATTSILTVSASPSGGTYTSTQLVTLSSNGISGTTIYYTTDGTTPTTSSSVYISPITVNTNETINFFAQDDVGNISSMQSVNYTINTTATVGNSLVGTATVA